MRTIPAGLFDAAGAVAASPARSGSRPAVSRTNLDPTAAVTILGIDPGIGCTGYGALRVEGGGTRLCIVEAGVLRSNASDTLEKRLAGLHEDFLVLMAEIKPDQVAVEEVYAKVKFPRTSIIMGHARGVILLAAGLADLAVHTYAASRVKQSVTGSGRASKEQVGRSVARALDLRKPPQPNDVTDALAVALCHAHVMRTARA